MACRWQPGMKITALLDALNSALAEPFDLSWSRDSLRFLLVFTVIYAVVVKRLWQYIVTRTVKERSYYRYENGQRVKHTVKPVLGERAAHNGKVVYSLDFEVTPHLLRHTYITNLIHASVDPKTVQYLAGHENSKITMDIYAKAKYNRPDELAGILEDTFTLWDAE